MHDRGMIKWMPFNSVVSSKEIINSYLEELKNNTDLSINSIHDIAIIIKEILI